MNIQQTTFPLTTIITLQEAKDHLRVTHNDEDGLIQECIRSATSHIERYTNIHLQSKSFVAYLDAKEVSAYGELDIWMYPVSGINSIKYLDTNGTETVFTAYTVDVTDSPVRILPTTVPSVQFNVLNQWRIYFSAGYTDRNKIDPELLGWVKIFTAFYYQTRQPEYTGITVNEIAYKFERALDKYRKDRIV